MEIFIISGFIIGYTKVTFQMCIFKFVDEPCIVITKNKICLRQSTVVLYYVITVSDGQSHL